MILEKLHWTVIVIIDPTNLHVTILSVSLHRVGEVLSNQMTIIHQFHTSNKQGFSVFRAKCSTYIY